MENAKKWRKKLDSLEHGVGVYFFKDARGRIIYIGKAVNLKARVKSYFVKNSLHGIKVSMLPEIAKIDYKTTETEIDALILESQLIKKHRPKYNVLLKDDKNYFYVVFTADEFPKVFITHQISKLQTPNSKLQFLGPYTDGQALKTTLRYLRRIFPYCTCKNQHKLPCLKSHLGLCLGICCVKQWGGSRPDVILGPFEMAKKTPRFFTALRMTYKKNIKSIIDILSGKRKNILKKMEKEMKMAAKNEDFENAAKLRDKISALKNIFEHKISTNASYILPRIDVLRRKEAKLELGKIFGANIERIEFYDISNISGQLAVGSMVVFDNGKIDKNQYRKFKIKTLFGSDDPAMIQEVLKRRLRHAQWPLPDLIIVDGGIAQFNAARKILKNTNILCASLAKNPDRLFLPPHLKTPYNSIKTQYFLKRCGGESPIKQIALKDLNENARLFLQNFRDEAHRFAISYHRKLRSKKLFIS